MVHSDFRVFSFLLLLFATTASAVASQSPAGTLQSSNSSQPARASNSGGAPCPCVPDIVQFQFDFQWGCNHPPVASDFAASSSCSITGSPRESSIKKVIIQDLANQRELSLDVQLILEDDGFDEEQEDDDPETEDDEQTSLRKRTKSSSSSAGRYTFNYPRSKAAPTVLWIDFHQTSAATRAPVASIDLNYQMGSIDCVSESNPIYYAGDWIYFLTVTKVGKISDRYCRPYDGDAATK